MKPDLKEENEKLLPGDRILVIGNIATPIVKAEAEANRQKLEERFGVFVSEKLSEVREISGEEVAALPVKYIEEAGKYGVHDVLWNIGVLAKKGFRVDVRKIPITVSAVEVCEMLELNPYEVDSKGCFVAVALNSGEVIRICQERNVPCKDIGYISKDNDKLLVNKDHNGYLNKRR